MIWVILTLLSILLTLLDLLLRYLKPMTRPSDVPPGVILKLANVVYQCWQVKDRAAQLGISPQWDAMEQPTDPTK